MQSFVQNYFGDERPLLGLRYTNVTLIFCFSFVKSGGAEREIWWMDEHSH